MAALDTSRIAAAALQVADERGPAGFTLKAVADVLGVTPTALYHHVDGKQGLANLLIDAAVREHPFPPPTGEWREDLWHVAKWIRDSAVAHPAVGPIGQMNNATTGSFLPVADRWLSIWQQAGLPLAQALIAASVTGLAVVGAVQTGMAQQAEELAIDEAAFALLPNARILLMSEHDADAEFELLVRSVVDGLYDRLISAVPG